MGKASKQETQEQDATAADGEEPAAVAEVVEAEGVEELPPILDPETGEVLDPKDFELPDPMALAVQDPADIFKRLDLEDERQIMEELQGRALDVMLYSFPGSDGKPQTGFSWKGSREAVRTLNSRGYTRIRISPEIEPKIETVTENGVDAYRVVVYAEDKLTGGGNYGVAACPVKMTLKSGGKKDDPFAVHKALSKSQRNAYEALIPLELVEYLKAQYLGLGQVKTIAGAGSAVEIERPQPLEDEEAREIIARIRELYDEIKAIDRLVMPPGQFNALLRQSEHSHDRLRDTEDHLKVFLDGEKDLAGRKAEFEKLVDEKTFDREIQKMRGMTQERRLGKLAELVEKHGPDE